MRRTAFTLIELATVLSVLAALAALLLPVLAAARERARATSCLSNVRELARAQMLYITDWDDMLPAWYFWDAQSGYLLWPRLFQPYLRAPAALICRSAPPIEPATPGVRLADYALFTWGGAGTGTALDPYWRWAGNMPLAAVRRPSETFNLMDGRTTTEMTRGFIPRHFDGMNAAHLDGHAAWVSPAEAYRISRTREGRWYYRHIAADVE